MVIQRTTTLQSQSGSDTLKLHFLPVQGHIRPGIHAQKIHDLDMRDPEYVLNCTHTRISVGKSQH